MLWQIGAGQSLSYQVVADVGDMAQAIEQAERLQDSSVDADADAGVPGFDLLQGRAGREGALGHNRHRQPAPPTGVVDVRAELSQGSPNSGRRVMGSLAFEAFALRIAKICSTKLTKIIALGRAFKLARALNGAHAGCLRQADACFLGKQSTFPPYPVRRPESASFATSEFRCQSCQPGWRCGDQNGFKLPVEAARDQHAHQDQDRA